MFNNLSIDISENEIKKRSYSLMKSLLMDQTTHDYIVWGTRDYESYGYLYKEKLPISMELITGENVNIIQPRINKEKNSKAKRKKDRAEVFTPSWMCNEQNNLIDNEWFGRDDIFNKPCYKSWITQNSKVQFANNNKKGWKDYVLEKRLEISCGEAPYLVSRYDTVTGEYIEINDRIGLLDRKLRIVNENTYNEQEWMSWAIRAFESIYGFEYQGDNLLLARENLLFTFIDYYQARFNKEPTLNQLLCISNIISWNLWQMDGINFTVPYSSDMNGKKDVVDGEINEECKEQFNFCRIMDWDTNRIVLYKSLL